MSEKSAWGKVIDQISSPWDWVMAAVGAAGGAVVTALTHGADLGTSIAAGATTAVAARKAASTSLQGWWLKRRAKGLESEIRKHESKNPQLIKLREELGRERSLLNSKAISKEDFAKQLDRITEEYRKLLSTP